MHFVQVKDILSFIGRYVDMAEEDGQVESTQSRAVDAAARGPMDGV
jgi:hypothetical protein